MYRRTSSPARWCPSALALGLALLAALAPVPLGASPTPLATQSAPLSFRPGVVLAVTDAAAFVGDGRTQALRPVSPALADALASLGLGAEPLGVGPEAAPRVLRLRSDRADFDPIAASRALAATGAFRAVCPDYRLRLFALPNDPGVPLQWYVDDGGVADIRLPAAWDVTHGDTSVVIAIMDTGVDTGHPDLASRIWRNRAEVPGNGVDDDGDGYVDDVMGWDFARHDADPNPEYTSDPSGLDVGFHGTFCAGIAAAATNNAEGIAGAGWDCRIMPLKVSDPDSGISSDAVAAAFLYAASHHASVLSMSFGAPADPGVPGFFQALVDIATGAGVLCVAAAGNDSSSAPNYPAACSGVLSVGASDETGARAWFSNWGPSVDVAAPGSGMWSTLCRNYTLTDLDQLFYILFFGWDGETPYMYGDGTSFACPLTAGVCGLVRARFPALDPLQVAAQVVQTGDAVTFDHPVGPRVNAARAVSTPYVAVDPAPAPARLSLAGPWPVPARRADAWTLSLALPHAERVALEVFDVRGRRVAARAEEPLDAGVHALRWAPRLPAAGVYFLRVRTRSGETLSTRLAVLD